MTFAQESLQLENKNVILLIYTLLDKITAFIVKWKYSQNRFELHVIDILYIFQHFIIQRQ